MVDGRTAQFLRQKTQFILKIVQIVLQEQHTCVWTGVMSAGLSPDSHHISCASCSWKEFTHRALCGLTETFLLYKTILTHRGRKLLGVSEVSEWLECAGSAGIAGCPGKD